MLDRLVDVAIGDQLDYTAFLNWREHVNGLQWNVVTVHNSAVDTIVLSCNVLLEVRNQLIEQAAIHHLARFRQYFTSRFINQWLCQTLVEQAILNVQLFIDFVTAYIGQIITFWVKETRDQQAF